MPLPETNTLQPVLVRVCEWTEWLPVELETVGQSRNGQTGEVVEQKAPIHNGYTGFNSHVFNGLEEKLLELTLEPSGRFREIELEPDDDEDEDAKPKTQRYGLYLFRAVLAINSTVNVVKEVLEDQREPLEMAKKRDEEQGRDKRADLVITDKMPPPPQMPNRKARRQGNRRG